MQASYPTCFCLVGANLLNSYVFPLVYSWLSSCIPMTFQLLPNDFPIAPKRTFFAFPWIYICIFMTFLLHPHAGISTLHLSTWLSSCIPMTFQFNHHDVPFTSQWNSVFVSHIPILFLLQIIIKDVVKWLFIYAEQILFWPRSLGAKKSEPVIALCGSPTTLFRSHDDCQDTVPTEEG